MNFRILIATGNENKVREIREIVRDEIPGGKELSVISMKQAGIHSDPEETGTTFGENALIKARSCAAALAAEAGPVLSVSDMPTIILADDSGLVVDALGGMPGILSARYMGRDTSYSVKMNHIMEEMKGLEGSARSARFVCACAAVLPEDLPVKMIRAPAGTPAIHFRAASGSPAELLTTGTMEGQIAHEIRGEGGFGYDPFFFLPDLGKTSAELTDEEKNAISHRGRAFRAMILGLKELLT